MVAVEQIEAGLDRMHVGAWDGLAPADVKRLVERLMRADARLKAQQIAATRVLDNSGLAKSEGASSTGAMLAGAFGGDRRNGDQMVRMGRTLEAAPQTADALAGGRIDTSQAAVIAAAVAVLRDLIPQEGTREITMATIMAQTATYFGLTLEDLRRRALRITDQFKTPDDADKIENDVLTDREGRARKRAEFWMVPNNDGTRRGGFVIPDAQADMLRAAIEAISAPRRDHLHNADADTESYYDRDLR